jgi:hypothetical protein
MSHRIIIACIMWLSIFAAIVMTGCSQEGAPARGARTVHPDGGAVPRDGLRVRRDEARNRIWLLGLDDVRVYDSEHGQLIRKIALPNWSVARFTCDPDMILDSAGSAIISSNVQSRLWRIDAASFEVNEHEIRLQGREQWDAGFSALAITADGSLLALMSFGGSLWNIDLGSGTARIFDPSTAFFNACGSTMAYRGKAASGLDAFTNFIPTAGSDYAAGVAGTNIIPATSRLDIAFERGRNP